MSGPLVWWANRKSRIGMSPAAARPPHAPGKEWWTTPPTTMPQPEHIEYVVQYQIEVMRLPASQDRTALQGHIGAWLRAARRLMHEEGRVIRGDLKTTEGLLLAARAMIHKLKGPARRVGMPLPDDFDEVVEALDARCAKIRREAAVKSSKTVSRAYWDPGKAGAP